MQAQATFLYVSRQRKVWLMSKMCIELPVIILIEGLLFHASLW